MNHISGKCEMTRRLTPLFGLTPLFVMTLALTGLAPQGVSAAEPLGRLIRFEYQSEKVEATRIKSFGDQWTLLDRAGRRWDIDKGQVQGLQETGSRFTGLSYSAMRTRLQEEFGNKYKVSGSGMFLVVHPAVSSDIWSKRFDDLYRSFQRYYNVRGFELKKPEFPLVAIVLPSKNAFQRYASEDKSNISAGVIGYYSPRTNRVATYDLGDGKKGEDWSQNAATIVHEATHQVAFNVGIHNRFSQSPRWLCEGLATVFEVPGVWNPRKYSAAKDRINRDRLAGFRQHREKFTPALLQQAIAGDRLFDSDMELAYAQAWAVSYFLFETRGRDFAKYVALAASRPDFQEYSAQERLADFTKVFGENLKLFNTKFVQFMDKVE